MEEAKTQKVKKPKVLKRKGKEVEEALLFEDQMDEAAIAEWERKMGLSGGETPQKVVSLGASKDSDKTEAQPEAANVIAGAPAEKSSKEDESWRQPGKLRWLSISGMGHYWRDADPRKRASIGVLAISFVFATCGVGLFLHGLLSEKKVEIERLTLPMFSHQLVLEMMIPIEEGNHGLLLSLALEIEEEGIRNWMVRRKILELISTLGHQDVKGPDGIERVREILDKGLCSQWPGIRPGSVRFLEYLLL